MSGSQPQALLAAVVCSSLLLLAACEQAGTAQRTLRAYDGPPLPRDKVSLLCSSPPFWVLCVDGKLLAPLVHMGAEILPGRHSAVVKCGGFFETTGRLTFEAEADRTYFVDGIPPVAAERVDFGVRDAGNGREGGARRSSSADHAKSAEARGGRGVTRLSAVSEKPRHDGIGDEHVSHLGAIDGTNGGSAVAEGGVDFLSRPRRGIGTAPAFPIPQGRTRYAAPLVGRSAMRRAQRSYSTSPCGPPFRHGIRRSRSPGPRSAGPCPPGCPAASTATCRCRPPRSAG